MRLPNVMPSPRTGAEPASDARTQVLRLRFGGILIAGAILVVLGVDRAMRGGPIWGAVMIISGALLLGWTSWSWARSKRG